MTRIIAVLLAGVLAACSAVRPDTAVSPQLDSGITSNNGGGTRTLGNQPGASATTRIGPAP
jgi:hypothetical protein